MRCERGHWMSHTPPAKDDVCPGGWYALVVVTKAEAEALPPGNAAALSNLIQEKCDSAGLTIRLAIEGLRGDSDAASMEA